MRRKEFFLTFPFETEGVCIETLLFSTFFDTVNYKSDRNNVSDCVHHTGVCSCSRLCC